MTFFSITFQKIILKPFRQGIGCLLKGCDKIIHVIGNNVRGIVIRITGNINVIYNKNKSAKKSRNKSDPSIEF